METSDSQVVAKWESLCYNPQMLYGDVETLGLLQAEGFVFTFQRIYLIVLRMDVRSLWAVNGLWELKIAQDNLPLDLQHSSNCRHSDQSASLGEVSQGCSYSSGNFSSH